MQNISSIAVSLWQILLSGQSQASWLECLLFYQWLCARAFVHIHSLRHAAAAGRSPRLGASDERCKLQRPWLQPPSQAGLSVLLLHMHLHQWR